MPSTVYARSRILLCCLQLNIGGMRLNTELQYSGLNAMMENIWEGRILVGGFLCFSLPLDCEFSETRHSGSLLTVVSPMPTKTLALSKHLLGECVKEGSAIVAGLEQNGIYEVGEGVEKRREAWSIPASKPGRASCESQLRPAG